MTLPFGKMGSPGFSKRKSFEHEREVRGIIQYEKDFLKNPALVFSPDCIQQLLDTQPKGLPLDTDLNSFITAIYVSPLSPPRFFDLVKNQADRHGLGDLVQKSKLLGEPVY